MLVRRHELLDLVQLVVEDRAGRVLLSVDDALAQRQDQLGEGDRRGGGAHRLHDGGVDGALQGAHLDALHVRRACGSARTLLVMLRKPFSEKPSVRMPVALRMSSQTCHSAGSRMNSQATAALSKR